MLALPILFGAGFQLPFRLTIPNLIAIAILIADGKATPEGIAVFVWQSQARRLDRIRGRGTSAIVRSLTSSIFVTIAETGIKVRGWF